MTISKFVLPVIIAGFAAGSAQAALRFNVVSDAGLIEGFVVNTITVDTDIDLNAISATSQLVSGTLNQLAFPPLFPDAETAPATADFGPGDSFVTIDGDQAVEARFGGGANTGGEAAPTFNTSGIDLTWDNVRTTDIGSGILIARLVFSDDASGSFQMMAFLDFRLDPNMSRVRANDLTQIVDGFLVPEPASFSLMALGCVTIKRRWRRRGDGIGASKSLG